jgi:hypothetical protein
MEQHLDALLESGRLPGDGASTMDECVEILASPPDYYATPGPGG